MTTSRRPRLLSGGWIYLWLLLVSLAVAAVSLSYPSTPSYDPWSWLLWGRQILHGTLDLTNNGSSWKPMPVIFTTVLALFGSAAPNLWLLVARAGFVLTLLMSGKLAWRLGRALVAETLGPPATDSERRLLGQVARIAPAALAFVIAVVGVALTHGFPGNSLLGYSEGLAVAATMIGAERAIDGHHRQAFALGLVPALDRPEVWVLWAPYGIWLMWKDRGARTLVVGLAVLMLLLWVVPQAVGGKNGLLTALHNHSKASAVNSSFPFFTELRTVEWSLVLTRVKLVGIVAMLVSAWTLWSHGRLSLHWRPADGRERALFALFMTGAFGFAWWIGIALETQVGFPGNPRYAVFGAVAEYICGAAAYAWAAAALSKRAAGWLASRELKVRPDLRMLGASGLLTLVFLFGPTWVGGSLLTLRSLRYEQRYQARIREQVSALINSHGGPQGILNCGSIVTDNHQVPMLAWYLNVHTRRIWAGSLVSPKYPANVIFQVSAGGGPNVLPSDDMVGTWIKNGTHYQITVTDPVTFYEHCQK